MPTGSMRPRTPTAASPPSAGVTSSPPGPVPSLTLQSFSSRHGRLLCGQPAGVCGHTRAASGGASAARRLDVEEANVLGVALDEVAPRLDVFAHQNAEQLVRGGCIVERHLAQRTGG